MSDITNLEQRLNSLSDLVSGLTQAGHAGLSPADLSSVDGAISELKGEVRTIQDRIRTVDHTARVAATSEVNSTIKKFQLKAVEAAISAIVSVEKDILARVDRTEAATQTETLEMKNAITAIRHLVSADSEACIATLRAALKEEF